MTGPDRLRREIDSLAGAPALVPLPCSGDPQQVGPLADALGKAGCTPAKETTP